MQAAMVTMWTGALVGREMKALEYGAEAIELWGKQAAAGRCTPPEFFFADAGGGMFMVRGDLAELRAIRDEEATLRLIARGLVVLDNYHIEFYDTGDAADAFMGRYATAVVELT